MTRGAKKSFLVKLFDSPSVDGVPGSSAPAAASAPASPAKGTKKVEVEETEDLRDALSKLQTKLVAMEIDLSGQEPTLVLP